MQEKTVEFSQLKLIPGQVLQLEFDGYSRERDKAVLIGYRAPHSLIITIPTVNGMSLNVKSEQKVNVRFFSNRVNGVCAFESQVILSSKAPYPHMHLTLPQSVFLGEVRSSVRAEVNIITRIELKGDVDPPTITSAKLLDLSAEGARLIGKVFDFDIDSKINLIFMIEVGDIERELNINAIVRSKSAIEQGFAIGVQFDNVEQNDRFALQAYVLSQLHEL